MESSLFEQKVTLGGQHGPVCAEDEKQARCTSKNTEHDLRNTTAWV